MVVHSNELLAFGGDHPPIGSRAVIEQAVGETIIGRFAGIYSMPQPVGETTTRPERQLVRIEGEVDIESGNQRSSHSIGLHEFLRGSVRLGFLPEQPIEGLGHLTVAAPTRSSYELPDITEDISEKRRFNGRQDILFRFTEEAQIEYLAAA